MGASAATSGIALECSLDDSTDPVGQTLLTYAVLPGLLSYACVMWTLEVVISYIVAFLRRPESSASARCCPGCMRVLTCRRSAEWDDHVQKAKDIVDEVRTESEQVRLWDAYRREVAFTPGLSRLSWFDSCCACCLEWCVCSSDGSQVHSRVDMLANAKQ